MKERRSRFWLVWLCGLLGILPLLVSCEGEDPAIPLEMRGLPYRARVAAEWGLPISDQSRPCNSSVWGDVDGDGFEEWFYGKDFYLIAARPALPYPEEYHWEPVPPPFHATRPVLDLCIDFDLEGDGRPDLLATATDSVRSEFRTWVFDPLDFSVKAEFAVTSPEGRFADGTWDGTFSLLGGIPRAEGSGQLVVFVVSPGQDVEGRGIWAVDPRTGEVVWRYLMGAPPRLVASQLVDLDGDGVPEILTGSAGTGNLDGERINGTSDDSSYVHVIGAKGELRWRHAVESAPSGARCTAGDVDGDGEIEVVAAGSNLIDDRAWLIVWNGHTGQEESRRRLTGNPQNILLSSFEAAAAPRIVLGFKGGELMTFRIEGRKGTTLIDSVDFVDSVDPRVVADVLGDETPEILVAFGKSGIVALDRSLEPQAFVAASRRTGPTTVKRLLVAPNRSLLQMARRPRQSVTFEPEPGLPWPAMTAGIVLLLAGVGFGIRRLRGRLRPDSPAVIRELRRQLLERLQILRHEKFGTLENLERLVWYLDAARAADDGGASQRVAIEKLVDDTRHTTLRRLREVAVLAGRVDVKEHKVAALTESCDEMATLLDLCAGAPAGENSAPVEALKTNGEALKIESWRIRREIESCFHADFAGTLAAVLRAQGPVFDKVGAGVTVCKEKVDPRSWQPPVGPRVLCDADELAFILDNLTGNSLRAMRGMSRRELTVEWEDQPTVVLCRITDTGCGIPPDDWERVLAGDGSTRADGGFGLRRSRESLKLFRGRLWIEASQPGGGTTFVLSLAVEGVGP